MSDVQVVTKFEFLPNEILIECFEYLNAIDIFDAFYFLNNRYYKLIQNIPLHLDFRHVQKSTFDQFCEWMLLNPKIQSQICSLQLSDENIYDQITTFFSRVSLDQLPHLRSLGLTEGKKMGEWGNMVWSNKIDNILATLPTFTIQALSIPMLEFNFVIIDQFTSIVNLTISRRCSVQQLCRFFKYAPKLKYLNVNSLMGYDRWRNNNPVSIDEHAATHLKQLIVHHTTAEFVKLETLLKKAQNLRSLTISVENDWELIDADGWQLLIQSSLPLLTIFKFKVNMPYVGEYHDINTEFQRFQSDFWHQQHWYTEYAFSSNCAYIYTIPYLSNEYTLQPYTNRYYDISNIHLGVFDKVTILTLSVNTITYTREHYFPCVKSLRLDNEYYQYYPEICVNRCLETKHIELLKMIVNLYNLKHLDISSRSLKIESPLVVLSLLKEAPNISSLKIEKDTLFSLFSNREVWEYMSKMITELDIGSNSFDNLYELMRVQRRFPNMEQLGCNCNRPNDILLIVNELAKLSKMKVFSFITHFPDEMNKWLEDHASQLNMYSLKIKCYTDYSPCSYKSDFYDDLYYDSFNEDNDDSDNDYDDCFDVNVYDFRPGKQSRVFF